MESPNLDVLRAIGVTAVFLFHLTLVLERASAHDFAWRMHALDPDPFGRAAVLLFFVHTAFVLMLSLDRSEHAGEAYATSFFIRRAFRIYPLSICCIVLLLALRIPHSIYRPFEFPGPRALLANLLLVQNVTKDWSITVPMWTLPYEAQSYALLPFVYITVKSNRTPKGAALWFMGTILAAYAAGRVVYRGGLILEFLPCFMAGVLAYKLAARQRVAQWPSWCWPLSILGLMLLYGFAVNAQHFSIWTYTTRGLVTEAGISLILGCILPGFKPASNVVFTSGCKIIAKYSYSIYLTHISIMWFAFMKLAAQPAPVRWLVFLILTPALPILLFHAVEWPAMQMGRRLSHAVRQGFGFRRTEVSS